MSVFRHPWGDFPELKAVASTSTVQTHPLFNEAFGNQQAARDLVASLAIPFPVEEIPASDYICPLIRKNERGQIDFTPVELARRLAEMSGAKLFDGITQTTPWLPESTPENIRFVSQPEFTGTPLPGSYLIVASYANLGSAIANLRGHILHHPNTSVSKAFVLSASMFANTLVPDKFLLDRISTIFSEKELAKLSTILGFPYSMLTQREAQFVNAIRKVEELTDLHKVAQSFNQRFSM